MTPEESLKVLSVFMLLIVSFIGIAIPIWLVRVDNVRVKYAFDVLRCISVGLIIGVALLHMLPEANFMLEEAIELQELGVQLGPSNETDLHFNETDHDHDHDHNETEHDHDHDHNETDYDHDHGNETDYHGNETHYHNETDHNETAPGGDPAALVDDHEGHDHDAEEAGHDEHDHDAEELGHAGHGHGHGHGEGGHSHPYPYAFLFATLGILLMLFLDQIGAHLAENAPPVKAGSVKSDASSTTDIEMSRAENHEGHNHDSGDLHSHHDATLSVATKEARLKAYVIEISIALHSILIGVGLGVLNEYRDLEILLVALCFHQLFEGIALGGAVVNANQSKLFLGALIVCFSFSCPLGVAIGAGIASSFERGPDGLWAQAVLSALACGTLLYIGLCDLLGQSFHKKNLGLKKFVMVFAVLVGLGLMAILAIWA